MAEHELIDFEVSADYVEHKTENMFKSYEDAKVSFIAHIKDNCFSVKITGYDDSGYGVSLDRYESE